MKTFRILMAAVAVSSTLGCRCGPPPNNAIKPDYVPTPTALSFEACPTKDEQGKVVNDVFPDIKKVLVSNRAKAGGGLKLSFTGTDADAFSVGAGAPMSIDSLSEAEIPVQFSPKKKGDLKAELVIDDETDDTPNQTVTLNGVGINLAAQATLETGPQKTDKSGYTVCQEGAPLSDCTLNFPDTLFNQSNTLELKIKNKGCPSLQVTSLAIESSRGDSQGFEIVSPTTLPSASAPITLNTADGTQEITVTIKFAPQDDNSGNFNRDAFLVIKSNDPNYGDGFAQPARVALSGIAVKPDIYATPGICDFSNPNDACGNTPKQANKAKFVITNSGNGPVEIESVTFANGGTGGRFSITTNIQGQTIASNSSKTLELSHSDMPLFVSDQVIIKGKIPGQASGSAGSITLQLFGGTKPCLTTDPIDTVNFNNPTQELTAQTLTIKNGAGCGTLIINSVSIDAQPFFSLIDPKVMAGTMIAGGSQAEATIQYKRPASGGMQLGTLRIASNDPDFAPPANKLVQLQSQSPLDEIPVAAASACTPAQLINDPTCANGAGTSLSANLSTITAATDGKKYITISGFNSYDPDPAASGGKKAVAAWKFKMLPPIPGNAPTSILENNDTFITMPTVKMEVSATGLYRVQLQVRDDRMQLSSNSAVISVNVYP